MSLTSHYLVLDLGTSSSKAFIFNARQELVFTHRVKHALHRPAPHHVESDASDIQAAVDALTSRSLDWASENNITLEAAGLACQRSTFLFWDKARLQPLSPALSWQDSRAGDVVERLLPHATQIHEKTGIPLSAHFGGPKYRHMLDHHPELEAIVQREEAWFGPISTFIVAHLTGTLAVDESIAGRSLLFNLDQRRWDTDLLTLLDIHPSTLPALQPVVADWGNLGGPEGAIPLRCVIGDQQAALIGQQGISTGALAMNFGTSGSVQLNTGGEPRHSSGLLSNVLVSDSKQAVYLLEGTINACNSLFYWLEDKLDFSHTDMVWHERAARIETQGALVPGFVGLAAPYWKDRFSTVYHNLSSPTPDELVRAAMESIGFLVHDILMTMETELNQEPLSASGGGSRPALLEFLADLLNRPVGHSSMRDRTALGVLQLLLHANALGEMTTAPAYDAIYHPRKNETWRREKLKTWAAALKQVGIEAVKKV